MSEQDIRYYQASCPHGHMKLEIPAPGGKLPTGQDADDLIYMLQLVIRQLERARDSADKGATT